MSKFDMPLSCQFDIPLSCPSCGDKMYITSYEAQLKILKERSWQICSECGSERTTDDFKKKLFTV